MFTWLSWTNETLPELLPRIVRLFIDLTVATGALGVIITGLAAIHVLRQARSHRV